MLRFYRYMIDTNTFNAQIFIINGVKQGCLWYVISFNLSYSPTIKNNLNLSACTIMAKENHEDSRCCLHVFIMRYLHFPDQCESSINKCILSHFASVCVWVWYTAELVITNLTRALSLSTVNCLIDYIVLQTKKHFVVSNLLLIGKVRRPLRSRYLHSSLFWKELHRTTIAEHFLDFTCELLTLMSTSIQAIRKKESCLATVKRMTDKKKRAGWLVIQRALTATKLWGRVRLKVCVRE